MCQRPECSPDARSDRHAKLTRYLDIFQEADEAYFQREHVVPTARIELLPTETAQEWIDLSHELYGSCEFCEGTPQKGMTHTPHVLPVA